MSKWYEYLGDWERPISRGVERKLVPEYMKSFMNKNKAIKDFNSRGWGGPVQQEMTGEEGQDAYKRSKTSGYLKKVGTVAAILGALYGGGAAMGAGGGSAGAGGGAGGSAGAGGGAGGGASGAGAGGLGSGGYSVAPLAGSQGGASGLSYGAVGTGGSGVSGSMAGGSSGAYGIGATGGSPAAGTALGNFGVSPLAGTFKGGGGTFLDSGFSGAGAGGGGTNWMEIIQNLLNQKGQQEQEPGQQAEQERVLGKRMNNLYIPVQPSPMSGRELGGGRNYGNLFS